MTDKLLTVALAAFTTACVLILAYLAVLFYLYFGWALA